MNNKRILVADEEESIISQLKEYLSLNGYEVIVANNGKEAFDKAMRESLALIILEVDLTELDGYSVCKLLRAEGCKTPIIFLTNKTLEIHAIIGLELGAQDYVRKPLQAKELLARIDLLLKREQINIIKKIVVNELEIDIERRIVKQKGKTMELTNKEFKLLYTLAQSPNKVFSRNELLNTVWEHSQITQTRTVDLHMGYLRRKLEENPRRPKLFKTIRGAGYFLDNEIPTSPPQAGKLKLP